VREGSPPSGRDVLPAIAMFGDGTKAGPASILNEENEPAIEGGPAVPAAFSARPDHPISGSRNSLHMLANKMGQTDGTPKN
jgi:hypothetical protein